ncbi:pyroglutamyl-peptidase I [Olsenella urininfantis]|uniref:pyroglutamyl-peptidase I n=1 Tax=Olsenella urininfantis TaxID=1871033 RepID=UPI000984DADA|nr:pyroglutamyl-peptidase I [Olsenella urininfantis]
MKKVLVTGFQPFGGEPMNPAWEAVRALPDVIAGAEVVKAEVPVVFGAGFAAVEEKIDECSPDLVLCIGQAGGRAKLSPEFVGINCADARIPDNDGNQPLAERIVEDGPDAYFSSLPVRAMAKAMNEAGIPAEVSFTAGTYVCNDMLYRLMHCLATKHPAVAGGFMHVPFAPVQATRLPSATPSMSLADMTAGIQLALEVALAGKEDTSASMGATH